MRNVRWSWGNVFVSFLYISISNAGHCTAKPAKVLLMARISLLSTSGICWVISGLSSTLMEWVEYYYCVCWLRCLPDHDGSQFPVLFIHRQIFFINNHENKKIRKGSINRPKASIGINRSIKLLWVIGLEQPINRTTSHNWNIFRFI